MKSKNEDRYFCPICCNYNSFEPAGVKRKPNRKCSVCKSLERHRLLYLYLKQHTSIFVQNVRMLHVAPEETFAAIFSNMKNVDYFPSDINKFRKHVRYQIDIQHIEFPDNYFDYILCSHVLEHVPNDVQALKEFYRVLKPSSRAIILVPINSQYHVTFEDFSKKTDGERLKYFGHKDHVRIYGLDFVERVKAAGFTVDVVDFWKQYNKYIFHFMKLNPDTFFICTK